MPRLPVDPSSAAPALERLSARSRTSALWLLLAASVVEPAWTAVDRILEGPAVAREFLVPRLLCAVVMLAAAVVVWRHPVGRRHAGAVAGLAVMPVQVTIGWMVPRVTHPELYVLGGTLMLYAVGAVLLAGWGWTAVQGALVAVGFAVGASTDVFDEAAADPVSWTVYLGTATLAAAVGHALRQRAVLAEVRWAVALESEQQRTQELVVELERLSSEDPLTGLVNRRRWDDALDSARELAGSLTVLLVDVDHFKSINDSGGHPAGDRALQQVAVALVTAVRSEDVVARLGGDEFGVLLRGLPPEAAGVIAEAVRERVEALARDGLSVPITLSIGLASAQGPGVDVPDLLRTADRMLYRAKTTRNAVVADLAPHRRADADDGRTTTVRDGVRLPG